MTPRYTRNSRYGSRYGAAARWRDGSIISLRDLSVLRGGQVIGTYSFRPGSGYVFRSYEVKSPSIGPFMTPRELVRAIARLPEPVQRPFQSDEAVSP